jgi:chromosome partitioning protein
VHVKDVQAGRVPAAAYVCGKPIAVGMKIITFANHKGGVGKTTSTLNVAYSLVQQGYRVLLVDTDAQRNLTRSLPLPVVYPDLGLVLKNEATLEQVVLENVDENLSLIASTRELEYLEKVLTQQFGYEHLLRNGLAPLADRYDYCLIDTPPRLSALTYAALVASQAVFIPCQPEFYGYEGLTDLLEACYRVNRHFNAELVIGGLFFTKYSSKYRKRLHHEVVDLIGQQYAGEGFVLTTTIRENVALAEAQAQKQSIHAWAPGSNGASDYETLTREMLTRL